jgi:hypothetical protein
MFLSSSRHLATALTETKDCLRPISSKGQKEFAWHDRLIFEMRDRLEHVRHFIYKVFAISFQGFPLHMISIQRAHTPCCYTIFNHFEVIQQALIINFIKALL